MGGKVTLLGLVFAIYFAVAWSYPSGMNSSSYNNGTSNNNDTKNGTDSKYLLCGSINQVVADTKYYFKSWPYGQGYGYRKRSEGKISKRDASKIDGMDDGGDELLEEPEFMEDSIYLERSRRYAAKNNRANCMISFVRKDNCRLILHFSNFYPGEQSCYKQHVIMTDEDYAYQICGYRSPPREYESMTRTLVLTQFRREGVRLHKYEGYVICHSNLTDPDKDAAIYIPETEMEEAIPYKVNGYVPQYPAGMGMGGVKGIGNFYGFPMPGYANPGMYNRFPGMYNMYHAEENTTTAAPITGSPTTGNPGNGNPGNGNGNPGNGNGNPGNGNGNPGNGNGNPGNGNGNPGNGNGNPGNGNGNPGNGNGNPGNGNGNPGNGNGNPTPGQPTSTTSAPVTTTTTTAKTGSSTGGVSTTAVPSYNNHDYSSMGFGMGNQGYGKYGGNPGYPGMGGGYNGYGYGVPVYYGPPMLPMGGYYGYAPAGAPYYGSKNTNGRTYGGNNDRYPRYQGPGNGNSGGYGLGLESDTDSHSVQGVYHGQQQYHADHGSGSANMGGMHEGPKYTSFDDVYKYQADAVGEEAIPYENPFAGVVKYDQVWPPA